MVLHLVGYQKSSYQQRLARKILAKLEQKYLPSIWHANREMLVDFGSQPNGC